MSEKILVTGAAGFIGSHLIDHLLEKKIKPGALRLLIAPWNTLDNLPSLPFEIIKGDLRDTSVLKQAVKNIDVIYHLAAKIDFDGPTYESYKEINVDPTWELLKAARNNNLRKFIFYSSIGVYGLPAGIGPIEGWNETHEPSYTNWYGQSKWEGEEKVREAHQKWGIPYAIIRPASVYGPREKGPTLALYKAIKKGQFVMIGDGQNKMHYVFVTDLVDATYLAAKSNRVNGEYIVAGARPTTFENVIKSVAKSIHKPVPKWRMNINTAMQLATIMEKIGDAFNFKPPLFPSRVRTMTTTYYYDINRARTFLKYQPQVSFSKGAELTGSWYTNQGWV